MKRSEKQLPSKANFSTFLQLNYSNFRLKPYEKPKLSKKLNLKGSGASWKPKNVSRDNHSHHKVFETNSCEIEPYEKSLISVFQESFASINKRFILEGGLGAGPSFYGVWKLS